MSKLRIVYMGTPDFAVAPLKALVNSGCNIVGVVTNPDKPAGRGRKIQESPVKKYAEEQGFKILQPVKFRDEDFLKELRALQADLQIVVAFKMLPEAVWNMPPLGTVNLHASLLPDYRGAAPLNWAIINGEKRSGVSTFLLKHQIDTGNIIFQEEVAIGDNDTVGDLHDNLMATGAKLLVKTVTAIESGDYPLIAQDSLLKDREPKHAPKIFKEDCRIDWNDCLESIHNKIRGLSPYPAAWAEFEGEGVKALNMKIFTSEKEYFNDSEEGNIAAGTLLSDNKTFIKVAAADGYIVITDLQMAGKKRMKTEDFLRGFDITPFL